MKITAPTSALAAILGLALAGSSVALHAQTTTNSPVATAPTAAPAKSKSTAKPTDYAGILTAIDPSGTSVTVTGTKRTLIMAVTAKTKYRKDTPSLAKFAVGDHVSGSYTKDATGALTAHSIYKKATTTTTKKPATAPAAAPAPAAPVTQ